MTEITWQTQWERSGVSRWIIDRFEERYGTPTPLVFHTILNDDRLCGIDPFTFDAFESCPDHDVCHRLKKLGFPVTTNLETQARFTKETLQEGAIKLIIGVAAPIVAVVGAIGGGILWFARGD